MSASWSRSAFLTYASAHFQRRHKGSSFLHCPHFTTTFAFCNKPPDAEKSNCSISTFESYVICVSHNRNHTTEIPMTRAVRMPTSACTDTKNDSVSAARRVQEHQTCHAREHDTPRASQCAKRALTHSLTVAMVEQLPPSPSHTPQLSLYPSFGQGSHSSTSRNRCTMRPSSPRRVPHGLAPRQGSE